ncbi:MAG: hypothetical protein ABIC91_00665 [Nanoarchaeota archaeon]
MNNKKGWLQHPIGAGIIFFIVGMILMYLMCKGIIPLGGIKIC